MATQIRVPELGESVVEGTVGRWLKKEGDHVSAGEILVEVETDKVNLEVGAERAGVLARIEKQEGVDVRIGDVLGVIEEAPEKVGAAPEQPGPAPEKVVAAQKPAPGRAASTSAATPEKRPAPTTAAATHKPAPPPTAPEAIARETGADGDKVTPVARHLAEEQGIDLAKITGTGPGGRVTKQDVEDFARKQAGALPAAPEPVPTIRRDLQPPPPLKTATPSDREERVRMSRRRRTIAQRLLEASQTTAMLTTFNEIDMTAVMDIRGRRREAFKDQYGVGLGITSFFVKASIAALRKFPQINAEIQGDEIVFKHYYDIGIAVGASEGLVVPVLREADRMSFAEVERNIKSFADKAENGTLSVEDLRGGTFTITNGGVFGSLLSTPILNLPQVAILGLHKVEERPVAVNGQVVIRPMMYVALSYDHRIVDGREAVQFLVRIKELVQDPEVLLLEG